MKDKAAWGIVGALALAGVVGVSTQNGGKTAGDSESGALRVRARQTPARPSDSNEADSERACDDLAKVLQEFLSIPEAPRPGSCVPGYASKRAVNASIPTTLKQGAAPGPKFVIATLPDPIHTHLAVMFDRMAEVIQQAAQDENYSYEASWLPWDDKGDTYSRLKDEDQASHRKDLLEGQPGILVFRNGRSKSQSNDSLEPYQNGLIVFVVGEDPTKGIHTEQFTNALAWIKTLKRPDGNGRARIAILGPTFSGSFPSLAKLLSGGDSGQWLREIRNSPDDHLAIHSGTANSGALIVQFGQVLKSDPNLSKLNIDFHGFLERDEVGLERYCRAINSQVNSPASIAIISEDETAYGGAGSDPKQKRCLNDALWLYYPRDMSALRAAYQTSSIFNNATPQQSSDVARGRLPTDLADPEGQNHDTIQSFAGNQTPLSQESYLLGLVNAMRVRHIQYVILRSTNSLDQLFLASFLRRAYPDARIVTDNSDRLFKRERGATGMGGTMSLSTYPLLEREREWVDGKVGSSGQRLFNSDSSEGTYIALRLLLHTQALSEDPSANPADACTLPRDTGQFAPLTYSPSGSLPPLPLACRQLLPPIPDYGMPWWMIPNDCGGNCDVYQRPGTWLTVLGRDGYWPLAAINEKTVPNRAPADGPSAASEMPLSLKLWLVLLAGFVCFHMWCCWKASFTTKPSFRTHFANPRRWRHRVLVFLGGWFAAMLPLFVGWGCGAFDCFSAALFHPWLVRVIISLECLIALGASVANILRMDKLSSGRKVIESAKSCFPRIALSCTGSALGVILFFMAFVLPLQRGLIPANRFFTYYRNMHVLSGVSGAVPFLLLTLGMYAWFWHSLHGLALFGKDRCLLPSKADLALQVTDMKDVLRMFSQEEAAKPTEDAAMPLARQIIKLGMILAAGIVGIVIAVSRYPFDIYKSVPVRSLGAERYAIAFCLYLTICFSFILADAFQLLTTWTKLRQLLMFLDRTPLRRTLAALRGFSWGSVWGMSGNVLDVRYKLLSRQLESLGHTLAALEAKASDAARCCIAARSCIAVLAKLKQVDKANESNRLALAQSCLDALEQLRKSTPRGLAASLDAARDCIVAQRLGAVMADPSAMAAVQDCISALEKFVTCESEQIVAAERDAICALTETRQHGSEFAKWYAEGYRACDEGDLKSLETFQKSTAEAAGILLTRLLVPEWRTERNSLVLVEAARSGNNDDAQSTPPPLSEKQYIRDAEEFVCLPYMGFVQNILGRMRSMVMSVLWLFFASAIAISSYPFDPRQGLGGTILVLFIGLGAIIFYVYAEMHRDATLSHVTDTEPGKLGIDFWLKIVSFGIAPVLGLLTTVFPGIADFVFSRLQPGLQSIK